VIPRVDQWIVNNFYRGIAPNEIETMNYTRLKFWNGVHMTLLNEEKRQLAAARKRRGYE
jgi:hypothetical protein